MNEDLWGGHRVSVGVSCGRSVCGRLRRRRRRIDGSRLAAVVARVAPLPAVAWRAFGCARAAALDDSSRPRVAALPLSNAILSAFAFCLANTPGAAARQRELKLGIDEVGIELGRSCERL